MLSGQKLNGPAPLVDRTTGKVFLFVTSNTSNILVLSSDDSGQTWSAPSDVTADTKVTAGNNPGPSGAYPDTPWAWYVVGPGHGIQLEHGAHAGRLIISAYHRLTVDNHGPSWANVIYSDDHGASWHLGGGLDQTNSANDNSNES